MTKLERVDVYFKRITVVVREMNALKLASFLRQRNAALLYFLSIPKKSRPSAAIYRNV